MKRQRGTQQLSPWPVRLIAYAVLVAIALGSIWLIDHRAMQLMHAQNQHTHPSATQPTPGAAHA